MKYLLKNDIENAKYGRVIYNENKILLKGFLESIVYKAVDLGLPSGTLWADRNVGAFSPEDVGLYFQWGDTQGYRADQVGSEEGKKKFKWSDYKYSEGGVDSNTPNLIKYCNEANKGYNSFVDNKTVLDLEDDAAHSNIGFGWRTPSANDLDELFHYTDYEWVNLNGIYGRKIINRTDTTKYIFIPASGTVYDMVLDAYQQQGYLWTNSLYPDNSAGARVIGFNDMEHGTGTDNPRCSGIPIRGIIKP